MKKLLLSCAWLGCSLSSFAGLTFKSFECHPGTREIRINWSTYTDAGHSTYCIERSENGTGYREITRLEAPGSSSLNRYMYSDLQPVSGTAYYRIRHTDQNGNSLYSPVVAVKYIPVLQEGLIGVTPNPSFGTAIALNMTGFAEGKVRITIYDLSGKLCYSAFADVDIFGKGSLQIDPSGILVQGVYLVNAGTESGLVKQKIVIR